MQKYQNIAIIALIAILLSLSTTYLWYSYGTNSKNAPIEQAIKAKTSLSKELEDVRLEKNKQIEYDQKRVAELHNNIDKYNADCHAKWKTSSDKINEIKKKSEQADETIIKEIRNISGLKIEEKKQ